MARLTNDMRKDIIEYVVSKLFDKNIKDAESEFTKKAITHTRKIAKEINIPEELIESPVIGLRLRLSMFLQNVVRGDSTLSGSVSCTGYSFFNDGALEDAGMSKLCYMNNKAVVHSAEKLFLLQKDKDSFRKSLDISFSKITTTKMLKELMPELVELLPVSYTSIDGNSTGIIIDPKELEKSREVVERLRTCK